MALETSVAFTAAAAVLLVIAGPTMLLVVSYALGQGWRAALPKALGVVLGDFTAMTLSMLGVGTRNAVANPRTIRIFNRAGGTLLVGAGIATAAIRTGH